MRPLFTSYYCAVCDPRQEVFATATAAGKDTWGMLRVHSNKKEFQYRLLKNGDIMPIDAVNGWHCTRHTVAAGYVKDEADSDVAIRVAKEWDNSSYKDRGGWAITEYSGAQPGQVIRTIGRGENDLLMVTKPYHRF